MTKRSLVFCILCFVLLAATHTPARVFRKWRSASNSSRTLRSLGGTRAYESKMNVNNGKGILTVFGFEQDIRRVIGDLNRAFQTDAVAYMGGTMAFLTVRTESQVIRMVVIYLVKHRKTVIFKLEQTEEEFRSSKKPPDRHLLTAVSEYPQSTPTFYLKDEETGMAMAVSKSRSSPGTIQAFFKVQFAQLDWKGLYPLQAKDPTRTSEHTPPTRLAIYQKGPDLCYVYAAHTKTPGETRITLLHKRLSMK